MIKPLFDENKDKVEFYSKYISPVFDILGGLSERNKVWNIEDEMSFVVDTVDVADSLLNIIDKVSDPNSSVTLADFVNERVELVSKIQKMANSYLNFKNEDALFMELSAAALGYCANIVSTFDGVTPEENEKLGKAAVKLIGAAVTTALKDALGKDNKWTAPFGAVDAGVSVLIALVEGISEYEQKLNYYNEDGLPEDIAFKDAILDAVSGGLHDGFSNYAKGLDDVIFDVGQCIGEGFKWLDAKLSGKEDSYKFSITQKNYAECIRELAKKAEYGSTSADDYFEIDSSHVSLYAQDGNDIIKNIYPNVTIYGGHGNDGISIYEGAKSNSVFGGSGDDSINVYGNNSTIYGESNDDRLIVTGNKNELYGEDGNDAFMIKGGSNNTVTGGAGNDIIILDNAKSSIIDYTQGDGIDALYGYNVGDIIKIKGEYSKQISGNDVILQVANGGIIVKDSKDLKININRIEVEEDESLPSESTGGFNPLEGGLIEMPSFWNTANAIRGTSANNKIENTRDDVIIYGLSGDDTIINYGRNVTINAGDGNDHVKNYGENVEINGGNGNDYIYNEAEDATITGGKGNDTIDNTGDNSDIDGGADMDSINNSATNVRVYSYSDTSYINNTRDNVTIYGSEDNDYIFDSGSSVSINAGEGNNSISVDGSANGDNTIVAGNGNDTVQVGNREETETIVRYYNNISITGGNNYINNSNVELSTIAAGNGNDTIITGGGERNYLRYNYWYSSVVAGAGNNKITVNSDMTHGKIYSGVGNDFVSITGDGSENIVSLSGGNDSVITGGSSSTINVGVGNNFVTLNSGSKYNDIIAGNGNDYVVMNNSDGGNEVTLGNGSNTVKSLNGNESVYSGIGNDYVTIAGGYASVGDGKNKVSLTAAGDSTVIAGSGDDVINVATVEANRNYDYIDAGAGNNYINNSNVELSTIVAGNGNDTIITGGGERNYLRYNYWYSSVVAGAGNNKITVNSDMTRGAIYAGSGNDFVSVSGDGRNTIVTNHYYDGDYNYLNTIESGKGSDLIYTSGNSSFINAGSGRNYVSLGSGYYNTVLTGKGNDTIELAAENSNYNKIIFDGGKDIVYNYNSGDTIASTSNIDYYTLNNDVIVTNGKSSMTLKGAADKEIHTEKLSSGDTAYKILVADKTVGDTLSPEGKIVNTPDDTLPAVFIKNNSNSTLLSSTVFNDVIENKGSKVTVQAFSGNDQINNRGSKVSIVAGNGNDTVDNLGVQVTIDGGAGRDYFENYGKKVLIEGGDGNDSLSNYGARATINGGKGNDTIRNYSGDDGYGDSVTITGGTGNDYIYSNGDNVLYKFVVGDGKDTIDGFNSSSLLQISGGTGKYTQKISGKNTVITVGKESITLKNTKGKNIVIDGNYIYEGTWRLNGTKATYGSENKTLITVNGVKSLKGISLKGNVVTVSKNSLSTSKVTVSKGYTLALGSDITKSKTTAAGWSIKGTTATYKTKSISAGYTLASDKKSISYTKASGGATKITLSGLKSSTKASYLTLKNNVVTISKNAIGTGKITAKGDGYKFVLGSAGKLEYIETKATLQGSSGNDIISGGSKADTIFGGKGNDTLTGSKGSDIFIYANGDGKDIITDYSADDKIKITKGSISKAAVVGKNVVFTIGSGSITVQNGKGQKISIVDSNGKTTTKTYAKLASSADLIADDNFITANSQLDSILNVNKNYSADKLELSTNYGLMQNDSLQTVFNSKTDF